MDRLVVWLEEHNGKRENIGFISCDIEEAYPFGVCRNFPNVRIVYVHAVKLIVETMNYTARQSVESQVIKVRP